MYFMLKYRHDQHESYREINFNLRQCFFYQEISPAKFGDRFLARERRKFRLQWIDTRRRMISGALSNVVRAGEQLIAKIHAIVHAMHVCAHVVCANMSNTVGRWSPIKVVRRKHEGVRLPRICAPPCCNPRVLHSAVAAMSPPTRVDVLPLH